MKNKQKFNSGNTSTFGVLLLVIGGVLLLDRLDVIEVSWIFSWPFILIGVGVFSIVRHGFRNQFGVFMVFFGAFFLLKRENLIPDEYYNYLLPGGIIAIGLYLLLNRRSKSDDSNLGSEDFGFDDDDSKVLDSDYIKAEAFFAGVQRRLISKDFKGGKITTAFGGADIDLSKAEITDKAVLNIEVAFGGVKLIIPPHWEIQADVSNIFAGIEDKRAFPAVDQTERKILVIKGSVIFGGLDFKSY